MNEAIQFTLGTSNSAFKSGLAEAKSAVSGFKSDVTSMVTGLFAGVGIQQLVSDFARVQDLADGFGTTAEAIQRVRGAAEMAGTSVEVVAKAMAKLRADGGDALAKLGIDAETFANAGMDEQVLMVSQALDGITDPQERINTALEIFGVRGKEILPMLNQGYDALKASMDGTSVASNATVAALAAMDDRIASLTNTFKVWAANGIGSVTNSVEVLSAAFARAYAYAVNLPKGFKAAKQAADDVSQGYLDLIEKRQAEIDRKQRSRQSASGVKDAAEKSGSEKAPRESLADRETDLRLAAAEKQLSIEKQIENLALKRMGIESAIAREKDSEKKNKLEDLRYNQTKELMALEAEKRKQAKNEADEVDRESKKALADISKKDKAAAKIEAEKIMSAFKSRETDIGFASGEPGLTGAEKFGQRLAGVNYDAINSEAEKGVRLQEEMRDYLKAIEEKSWTVEIPEAE